MCCRYVYLSKRGYVLTLSSPDIIPGSRTCLWKAGPIAWRYQSSLNHKCVPHSMRPATPASHIARWDLYAASCGSSVHSHHIAYFFQAHSLCHGSLKTASSHDGAFSRYYLPISRRGIVHTYIQTTCAGGILELNKLLTRLTMTSYMCCTAYCPLFILDF